MSVFRSLLGVLRENRLGEEAYMRGRGYEKHTLHHRPEHVSKNFEGLGVPRPDGPPYHVWIHPEQVQGAGLTAPWTLGRRGVAYVEEILEKFERMGECISLAIKQGVPLRKYLDLHDHMEYMIHYVDIRLDVTEATRENVHVVGFVQRPKESDLLRVDMDFDGKTGERTKFEHSFMSSNGGSLTPVPTLLPGGPWR